MGNISLPIAESLKFSDFIINTVTADLDDTIARRRSRDTEGASIAWVIGHLIHYRQQMLELLAEPTSDAFAEQFGSTGATDGHDYPPLPTLLAAWNETSANVVEVVAAASDEVLTRPITDKDAPHGEKRIVDTMVFFMWHEAYHIGQIGTLRAQFGLTPTATLATAGTGA